LPLSDSRNEAIRNSRRVGAMLGERLEGRFKLALHDERGICRQPRTRVIE
jgi:hypothetical protein